ncbi:OsmC family protein [Paraflavitalea sp. CAU 1676]|uniref:OsmC family protein n=1 Tax=Paraflavitalea sp. CAU 1676 TaxID=3032598 RepID=UPI0023DA05ED|nr:OsmC family protein [Paraflavitalea sp. CAU 1676]MDF2189259.1 OsmC family protein [Paraflavitalea sp. CAU 1676]
MTSTVVYEGNLKTVCTHLKSGTQIFTDPPVDNQGKGESFSPTDLMATSLGACMLTIMGIKARDLEVDLTDTKIEVEKLMAADPRRVSGINVTFSFPETLVVDEKNKTILERAAHTCPVMYSIHPDIVVNVTFNWNPATITLKV